MFDDASRVPVYLQLAALLREQIIAGELGPGAMVPSEAYLASHYGVSRQTARQAVRVLREDQWVATRRARGSFVLAAPPPRVIWAEPGAQVRARRALPGDPPGGDVTVVVSHPGGAVTSGPAARTVVRVTGPGSDG